MSPHRPRSYRRGTSLQTPILTCGMTDLEALFGPLEANILRVLWAAPRPLPARLVHAQLRTYHERQLLASVRTTLMRLMQKGFITGTKTSPGSLCFAPVLSHDEYLRYVCHQVLQTLRHVVGDAIVTTTLQTMKDA